MNKEFLKERFLKLWHNKWVFGSIIAFLSAVFAIILATQFDSLELKSVDLRFAIRGAQDTDQDNIAIVAVDEESITALKKWPFPRNYFAKAILNLQKAGARLIVVDVEFTEPSDHKTGGRQDLNLAGAIKRAGNVIMAAELVNNDRVDKGIRNSYLVRPYSLFMKGTGTRWGLINVDEDSDGFIRRYLLFLPHNEKAVLPISLKAYQALRPGANGSRGVQIDDDGYFVLGAKRIPKVDYNSMFINFRGPAKSFRTFSFSSILDDSSFTLPGNEDTDIFEVYRESGVLRDKIVYIGASAEVLQDNKLTPFFSYQGRQKKLAGVEVHASALSTLLRGDFLVDQGWLSALLVVFVLSAATMGLTKWLKPFRGLFAALALILAYVILSIYLFINQLMVIDFVAPLFAIGLSFVGNVVHETLTEQRERIRIKKSWEQYMAKDVIDNMLDSGQLPTFGGERRELTVLFSDIRSFTTYSEKHSSKKVVGKLHEYLTEMVDSIFQYGGTLDKFVGDEIMAIYGAPHYYKEHAEKACLTAIDMIQRLRRLQRDWSASGEEYFQIGVGINSGKVILGNLGSQQLFDYTVIGDDVNLGARLEGANKQYGTSIILSENTYKLVKKKARVRELDLVRVKGKTKPVKIFELRGMKKLDDIEQDLIIDVYTTALNHYKECQWYAALKEFKRILRYFPTDGPTRVYIKRCMDFIETPPPRAWDGVYEFTTK